MISGQVENGHVLSTLVEEKRKDWNKVKNYLYDELISLAGLDPDDLSDCMEENLEYAMEIILRHGTYGENAHALRKYAQYFSLYELFES
jgi:hypothetical protein